MEVKEKLYARTRAAWRKWLAKHHDSASEIWLIFEEGGKLSYLDSVEEALCFGWVDSMQKRISPAEMAQRFSPRRPRSNWTELNKARCRRLIALGLMTEAGARKLPPLDEDFSVADDILQALAAEPGALETFNGFPLLYQRVRIGYIEEVRRKPADFEKRLGNFVTRTAAGKMFGTWNDGGRLADDG